jgi:hypothetical protein
MKPPSFEQIATVLRPLIRGELSKLATANPDSSFYGVALDCNVDCGAVFVSANTEAALRAHCLETKRVKPDRPLEKAMSELKWALGDWTYYCINAEADEWERQWTPIAVEIETYLDEVDDDDEASEWREQFLVTMCRILVSLENERAFDVLRRDSDFRLCCADHDEPLEAGEARMQRVRESE